MYTVRNDVVRRAVIPMTPYKVSRDSKTVKVLLDDARSHLASVLPVKR